MKRRIIYMLFVLFSSILSGQSFENFKNDFRFAIDKYFSEEKLNEMFRDYAGILTPHSDITQLLGNLKGSQNVAFPLAEFKNDTLYTNNIGSLFNSENPNRRILAYLVIAASGDSSFEERLLSKIKVEKKGGCLIWAGMALLYLKTNHTTELFDFLVENEEFGDAHMIPLFVQLNKDSLQQTAYLRINSDNIKAKILAAQILSFTKLNSKTELLLKKAVDEWSFNIKGYAIYSIKELRIGSLLESFKYLLDSSQTRSIALKALANSPTETDSKYLFDLVNSQDTVSSELLDCFYESKNIDNVRYWLSLLYSKPIPYNYVFFVFKQPLLESDSLLPDVYTALKKIKKADILAELVRALANRKDEISIDIMLKFLSHKSETVRYWAASSLKGKTSGKIKSTIPVILSSPKLRVTSLTTLAIENGVDTLQGMYEALLNNRKDRDWYRSAMEYLSEFPKDRHKKLFRSILRTSDHEHFDKCCAALGLARLKDTASVDMIISTCRQESRNSDYNARTFLVVLGMLKGDKAKAEVEKYKNSSEEVVRVLTKEILSKWDQK